MLKGICTVQKGQRTKLRCPSCKWPSHALQSTVGPLPNDASPRSTVFAKRYAERLGPTSRPTGCGTYFKFNHTNTQKNRLTLRLYRTTSPVRSLVPSGPAAPPPKAQAKPSLRRAVPPSTHATSAVLRGESAGWKSGSSTLFESSKSGSSVASRVACWAKCGGGRRLGRRLGEWGARDVLRGPGGASSALLE